MKTLAKFACAFVLAGGLASPAFAAQGDAAPAPTTGATSAGDSGASPTQGAASKPGAMGKNESGQTGMNTEQGATTGANMHMTQRLRADLGKAGFTDITVMPSSFLVRAKDSAGNPVMMLINPDSMTAITEESPGSNSASGANHMTNHMSSGASAGATPESGSTGGSTSAASPKP